MHFTRTDFFKFTLFAFLFFFLFLGYNRVSGPYFETTYDSASIENQEIPVSEIVAEDTKVIKRDPLKKNVQKSILTIAFHPEYVKIDAALMDRLKQVVYSSHFRSKITPLKLVLDAEREEPRGQVMGNKLILSTVIPSDSEQIKVFVHELGHIIDIFYLKKWHFSDPSDIFYNISWESFNIKKKGQKIANFVSGYALSNKYEDFAESFAMFVFHNEDFAKRASEDAILERKYDFFKSIIFKTDTFLDTSFETGSLKTYNWDITKVPIDTEKYLYYIR